MRSFARVLVVGSMVSLLAGAAGIPAAGADPSASASPAPSQAFAPGFATPEDAVRAYLDGMKAADLDQVLAAAAIDEMAGMIDFAGWVDRLHAWLPFQAPVPASDPFLVGMNHSQQEAQLLGQARNLLYGLLTDVDLEGTIVVADAAWARAFEQQLDLGRLAGLTVGDVLISDPEHMSTERYTELMAKQAAVWGADEITERVASLGLEGREAIVGFTLIRYGESWKVMSQTSAMAGLPASGAPSFIE